MSSRNYTQKRIEKRRFEPGDRSPAAEGGRWRKERTSFENFARTTLNEVPRCEIDYVAIVDKETLAPIRTVERGGRILLAVRFRQRPWVRLIDNGPL